ncbi:unnamed protein product [Linum tenue]|uniref:Uncharacterized protein n=1 Tax=Linum tenue TaxID=586396 RepID=A0AAV0N8M6_9ROSI|nr:unnamed protein product [Linum tenue]CAI0456279.1 unnamed protein product [Linum tenue]
MIMPHGLQLGTKR